MALTKVTGSGANGLTLSSTDVTVASGDLLFGTADKGVVLGVTSNTAANTLDDYEEGTWTPALESSGGTLSVSYTLRSGKYIKIGSLCQASFVFRVSSHSGGSGEYRITGLPFTSSTAGSDHIGVSTMGGENHPIGSQHQLIQVMNNGETKVRLLYMNNNATWASYTPGSNFTAFMCFTYPTA